MRPSGTVQTVMMMDGIKPRMAAPATTGHRIMKWSIRRPRTQTTATLTGKAQDG